MRLPLGKTLDLELMDTETSIMVVRDIFLFTS